MQSQNDMGGCVELAVDLMTIASVREFRAWVAERVGHAQTPGPRMVGRLGSADERWRQMTACWR